MRPLPLRQRAMRAMIHGIVFATAGALGLALIGGVALLIWIAAQALTG